tara:strand:+ start:1276 stop:2292 length:1017 start_codon:yes stop_codon:yes gene_type:complete
MAPFAGWQMPIQYEGIVAEHRAVRENAGVFDISHMGEFEVSGPGSGAWLNKLLTNDLGDLNDGEGQYTLMLNQAGGVIDDLIIYRLSEDCHFLVVNAAKLDEDAEWLRRHVTEGIEFVDRSAEFGAIAVQGPSVVEIWNQIEPGHELPARNGILIRADGVVLCRTGYTGEDGFELFAPPEAISKWFDTFLGAGAVPCGLGARDTLRLEKGYPLNGSDLDPIHTPLEAGLGFFVKMGKEDGFMGCDVLKAQAEAGLTQRLVAIALQGKAPPPRHGYEIRNADGSEVIAELTSGSLSPSLGIGIGMAYLPVDQAKIGTEVSVAVRDRLFPAKVVKKPFLK